MEFAKDLFKNHRYAILGLGKNGNAAALRLQAMGATIQIWDDQPQKRQETPPQLQNYIKEFSSLEGFDALVLSPGIPHYLPTPHPVALLAQEAHIPILSDAELLFKAVKASHSTARFAAITGTNGKSTTTVLLAHLLKHAGIPSAAGGNLGPAALALPYLDGNGVYVLEMSSYMLERLSQFVADTACFLNITPDHLDRHGDMEHYTEAKMHIFDHQNASCQAVIGIEEVLCQKAAQTLLQRGISVTTITGLNKSADIWVENNILQDKNGKIADLGKALFLPGSHNAQNAAAATAMALYLGVPREEIEPGLITFKGLAHRQRPVATIDGITFIDDSKATNADAAARALQCYDDIIWIAGGMAKAGGIDDLAPYFPRISLVLLIGRDAPLLAETLERYSVSYKIVGTLEKAVASAFEIAKQEKISTVLLSPACASFDQFRSFEERGDIFAQQVQMLRKNDLS